MVNNNIYTTKFYQGRIELIRKDEYERTTSGLRRPSTERYVADKTVAILVSRNTLQAQLKATRSEVSQNLDYGAPSDDGTIIARPLDLELYKEQQSIISNCLNKILTIDKAIMALSEMDCPFYGDLDADIRVLEQQLRAVTTKTKNYQTRTDAEDPYIKSQLKILSKELASLEGTMKIKQDTKAQMDKILSTIDDL